MEAVSEPRLWERLRKIQLKLQALSLEAQALAEELRTIEEGDFRDELREDPYP